MKGRIKMKKIIPFKKEILFKTKINEITSISLEHDYQLEDGSISGKFFVTGDYKMTESSIQREKFSYDIPFDIALDPRINPQKLNFDIENFYYEVINEEILKVNIDVFLEGEYQEPQEIKIEKVQELTSPSSTEEPLPSLKDIPQEKNSLPFLTPEQKISEERVEPLLEKDSPSILPIVTDNQEERIKSIIKLTPDPKETKEIKEINMFSQETTEETYATYHVYLVKENDTIESILTKYGVTKDEVIEYNDLNAINKGDKLIIPCHYE